MIMDKIKILDEIINNDNKLLLIKTENHDLFVPFNLSNNIGKDYDNLLIIINEYGFKNFKIIKTSTRFDD